MGGELEKIILYKWFGQLEGGKFKGLGSRIAWHKVYVEIIKQGDLLQKPQIS